MMEKDKKEKNMAGEIKDKKHFRQTHLLDMYGIDISIP